MLRVAYIANTLAEVPKPLTEKELIHQAAVITLAEVTHINREKAKLMFGPEREEIRQLELKLAALKASKLRKS